MSDMTSAVAIDLLDNLIGMVDDNQENDYDSALHMAINALKAQSDGDTISRKATIDAMEDVDWYHINKDGQLTHGANSKEDEPLYKAEDVYKVLNDVPSAQPEIIHCNDCKHKGTKNCVANAWTTIFGVMVKDDFYCGLAERRTDDPD